MADLKDFVLVDIKRQVPLHTFRATNLQRARELCADTEFGRSQFDEDGEPLEEVFAKFGVDVFEVDERWVQELNTPQRIIGIDEVGLGALAGPLVVCAFSAPSDDWKMLKLTDSKKLGKVTREQLAQELMTQFPDHYVLIQVEPSDIDKHGIGKCLPMAMERALERLVAKVGVPNRVIIDGEDKGVCAGAEFYPKADLNYPAVSAASVIAKVHRDRLMKEYSKSYPKWGFEQHVGYPTQAHRDALKKHGMSPIHRRSYKSQGMEQH
jgi:ribonuclease HII